MRKHVVAGVVALAGALVLAAAPSAEAAWPWPTKPTSTKPTAPAPTAAPADCGTALAKTDGSAWTCTFADNFDGASLNRTKWMVQTNFSSGTATTHPCYVDNGSTVAVADGEIGRASCRERGEIGV